MQQKSALEHFVENKSTQYLTYLTNQTIRTLKDNGFIQAYSGINEDPDAWAKVLVFLYNKDILESKDKHKYQMENIASCVQDAHIIYSHSVDRGEFIALVFTLDPYAQKIMDKIWAGKYSEIPTDYKKKWFDETMVITGFSSLAKKHHVVYRTEFLRKETEKEFRVNLETFHELESKPLFQEEILGYIDVPKEEDLVHLARLQDDTNFLEKLQKETIEAKFAGMKEHYANKFPQLH